MRSPLFASFTAPVADELDERADLLVTAIDALVQCAAPLGDRNRMVQFEAVKLRALTMMLAGAIKHPHQDADQHELIFAAVLADMQQYAGLVVPA